MNWHSESVVQPFRCEEIFSEEHLHETTNDEIHRCRRNFWFRKWRNYCIYFLPAHRYTAFSDEFPEKTKTNWRLLDFPNIWVFVKQIWLFEDILNIYFLEQLLMEMVFFRTTVIQFNSNWKIISAYLTWHSFNTSVGMDESNLFIVSISFGSCILLFSSNKTIDVDVVSEFI